MSTTTSCWDCDDLHTGKTKRRYDIMTEKLNILKDLKRLTKSYQASAIADHITSTGHSIKLEHFEILATERSDLHFRIKESLLMKDLKLSLIENVGS